MKNNVQLTIKYNDNWATNNITQIVTAQFETTSEGISREDVERAVKQIVKLIKKDCTVNMYLGINYSFHAATCQRFVCNWKGELTKGVMNENNSDFGSFVKCSKSDVVASAEFMRSLAVYASND